MEPSRRNGNTWICCKRIPDMAQVLVASNACMYENQNCHCFLSLFSLLCKHSQFRGLKCMRMHVCTCRLASTTSKWLNICRVMFCLNFVHLWCLRHIGKILKLRLIHTLWRPSNLCLLSYASYIAQYSTDLFIRSSFQWLKVRTYLNK